MFILLFKRLFIHQGPRSLNLKLCIAYWTVFFNYSRIVKTYASYLHKTIELHSKFSNNVLFGKNKIMESGEDIAKP